MISSKDMFINYNFNLCDTIMEQKDKQANWADMSDGEEESAQQLQKEEKKEEKKPVPPEQKGMKNSRGDYVVTSIDIPDMRGGVKKDGSGTAEAEQASDSDTEYDEEDDQKEQAPADEKKEGKLSDARTGVGMASKT